MRNRMVTMVSGLGLLLYMGCADPGTESPSDPAPDRAATADASALLQVQIENGHSVSFREPVPGGLYVMEQMLPGQSFVLGRDGAIDAIDAFTMLRPGVAVPA